MNKEEIFYSENIRRFNEGNRSSDVIESKLGIVFSTWLITLGYLNSDNFLAILKVDNIFIKHLFYLDIILICISAYFIFKGLAVQKNFLGFNISDINKIQKKSKVSNEKTIINHGISKAIVYNDELRKLKVKYLKNSFFVLIFSVLILSFLKIYLYLLINN